MGLCHSVHTACAHLRKLLFHLSPVVPTIAVVMIPLAVNLSGVVSRDLIVRMPIEEAKEL